MRIFVLGDDAPRKTLNWDLLQKTNIEFVRGVLEGHYLGDGHHKHTKKFSIYSTSSKLIYQLRTLYSLFGLHPRIGHGKQSKKNPKHHDLWYLEFFANYLSFNDLMDKGQVRIPGTRIVRHEDYFIGKIKTEGRPDLIKEGIRVFDIKVEEDSSFVAESIILHNCDFISSGETFLQPSEMDYLRGMIRTPARKEGVANSVWIWEDPYPGKKYVISADVARGDSGDFSAFHVIDSDEAEVVAEYLGKIPPDKFAELLIEYGKKYNGAVLCPERNTFGYFTCVKLRDSGYKRLWYRNMSADMWTFIQSDPEQVPGFETQGNTRPQILGKLEELIRNQVVKTYSQRTYDQLQSFVWQGAKAQASRDSNDDLILSLAIGLWLTHGSTSFNENGRDLALAMLQSTKIDRRDHSIFPVDYNAVKPIFSSTAYNPTNAFRPREAPEGNMSDFAWLLK
jgi:hypothetical protein